MRRAKLEDEAVERYMAARALVIEDAHEPGDEAALFHLFNAAKRRGSPKWRRDATSPSLSGR